MKICHIKYSLNKTLKHQLLTRRPCRFKKKNQDTSGLVHFFSGSLWCLSEFIEFSALLRVAERKVDTLVLCCGIWKALRQPSLTAILEPAPTEMSFEATKDAYLGFTVFSALAIFSSVVCCSFEAGVGQSTLACSICTVPAWVPAPHAAHSQTQSIQGCRSPKPRQNYTPHTL